MSNPNLALETGGSLNHYLPEHSTQLAALTGTAANYLDSIKPKQAPSGPLDDALPTNKDQEAAYHRQLDIAQQPLIILGHIKEGNLSAQDKQTLTTLYPKLYSKMAKEINESIITAKTDKKAMPYKQRLSLSLFLGQPLDATLTQPVMLAAMMSNTPKATPQPAQGKKKPATKTAVEQQNKLSDLLETNTQSTDKNQK